MQKHLLYINLFTITSALALAACADEVDGVVTPDVPEVGEKTPIELSVGIESNTRAVNINGMGTIHAFEKDTRLFLFMLDKKDGVNNNFELATANCIARGKGEDAASDESFSTIDYNGDNCRPLYWDDTHYRREACVSVYGVAVPGVLATLNQKFNYNVDFSNYDQSWFYPTSLDMPVNWSWDVLVDGKQTKSSVTSGKDLCYTKNQSSEGLSETRTTSKGPLKFSNTITGKFDQGHLLFDHALALFDIELWCGEGYDSSSENNFQFESGKNIQMTGFNSAGALNLRTGEWGSLSSSVFVSIYNTDEHTDGTKPGYRTSDNSKPYYTLLAFVVPGTDISAEVANALEFSIDNSTYKVPMSAIYSAIKTGNFNNEEISDWSKFLDKKTSEGTEYTRIKAGVCYKLKLTVSKSTINSVSAQITDWSTVIAKEADAQIQVTADNYEPSSMTDKRVDAFDLYVKQSGNVTSYTQHSEVTTATASDGTESYQFSPTLYWPASTSKYYLRGFVDPVSNKPSLKTTDGFIPITGTSETDGYAIIMTRGNDYQWGASYNGADWGTAISPTAGNVHLQFKHVMGQVKVIVNTTDGDDRVDLAGSKCVITGLNKEATINLHTGKVTPKTGSDNTENYIVYDLTSGSESPNTTEGYTQFQIPQAAFTATDDIKFVITLKDGTKYELPLSAAALTTGDNKITQWEQGKSYQYTLTLKKQEIKVAAQLTDWGTLNTAGSDIQL